ncbi:LysR family transcriptional regulator [Salinisphaera sp. USBA-960]|uniref:LysR family transcriptional regulator n=1 Tax=Salinisphaera orenii TaxID=856731 RepID=UPI000DBE7301|nr:LysR family transcriptional regulator [Salifodinibacter halophilus]NNC25827.1 LysR family transcriptional regulator [Salifodinibacter halophilus]
MLNPQWLRSFVTLAELGQFTQAAEHLGLTQAAVSQHIRRLEDELGPVFVRRSSGVELTPAGEALTEYCRDLGQADRRLRLRLAESEAEQGEIGLITPGSVGLFLFPVLMELQQSKPRLSLRHRFAPDTEVLEAVLDNHYDLGVLTFEPDDPRVTASHFAEEPLELVVPAGASADDWADLEALGFIDHPDGQAMAGRLLQRVFPRAPGIEAIRRHMFINQIGLILEPVSRGIGFTVIPRYARCAFARQEEIRAIDYGQLAIDTLWMIHRSEWALPPAVHCVAQRLRTKSRFQKALSASA